MIRKYSLLRSSFATMLAVLVGGAPTLFNASNAFAAPRKPPAETDPAAKVTAVEIGLAVGETKTITLADIDSFHIATQGVVDVKFNGDSVVFSGSHEGSSSVTFFLRNKQEVDYLVNVFSRDVDKVAKELDQLLEGYTGVRWRRVGPRFFIEGGVSTEGDARRIALIAALYAGQVESLVVVGSVGAEHSINVRVDFFFVQYDRSSSYGIGISYPTQVGGGSSVALAVPLQVGKTAVPDPSAAFSFSQPLPALDLAETHGWAKVLKHSTVITTSGSEATFKSGGEQNFQIATAQATGVHAIPYGTNVTVLPRYDPRSRDLDVKVGADMADLTPPEGATSLPGRKTTTIQTFVHLKLGESIVLSGIRTSSQTHSVAGIPGLDWIPILGFLFASHTNSVAETEGALFIIPSVVEAVPKRSFDMIEEAMKQYEDFGSTLNGSGDMDSVKSYPHQPPAYVK